MEKFLNRYLQKHLFLAAEKHGSKEKDKGKLKISVINERIFDLQISVKHN